MLVLVTSNHLQEIQKNKEDTKVLWKVLGKEKKVTEEINPDVLIFLWKKKIDFTHTFFWPVAFYVH